jgi:hypothetical protein
MLKFYITGFGEFAGVTDNPTTRLIHNLSSELAYNPLPSSLTLATCTVLHVSAQRSLSSLNNFNRSIAEEESIDPPIPQRTIFVSIIIIIVINLYIHIQCCIVC